MNALKWVLGMTWLVTCFLSEAMCVVISFDGGPIWLGVAGAVGFLIWYWNAYMILSNTWARKHPTRRAT